MFRKHKRKITMALLVVMVLSVVIGAFSQIAMADGVEKVITLIHVNDVHGRIDEDERDKAIGFPKFKTKLDEIKKENPNVLLLNGGDTFHGTTDVNITEGEAMVNMMNLLGFDAMVPGNHDFNFGYERLIELKEMAKFPLITSNVVKEKDGKSDFDATMVKEIDGIKVGIFGLTTEETKFKTHPDNTVGIKFENAVETAKKSVKALEDEDVDIIIALAHLGNEGTTLTTSRQVLEEVKGIDIMVDGHSHEELNEKVGEALLVQAGEHTKNIGRVDIKLKDKKISSTEASLITYDEMKDIKADKEMVDEVEKIKEKNKPLLGEVIGESKVDLDGEREDVRTKETNLGNFIADVMIESTDADIAFTNGGGIRAPIEKGELTVGDIITTVPFSNTLAVIEATGEEIIAALERGVDSYPEAAGHFPQIAGMKYSFDPKSEVGNRIVEVTVAGEKIDKAKEYKVVTNDFLAAGGDGYTMFEGKTFIAEGGLLSDIVIDYVKKNKVIDPKVEGRITQAEKPASEKPVEPKDPKVISISVDEKVLDIPAEFGAPFITGGRTLVPLRAVSENLGHEVKWDGKTRQVTIDGKIILTIDETKVMVDGEEQKLEVAAQIKDGRTYVPIRFISETLGYKVDWDNDSRTVLIQTKDEGKVIDIEKPADKEIKEMKEVKDAA